MRLIPSLVRSNAVACTHASQSISIRHTVCVCISVRLYAPQSMCIYLSPSLLLSARHGDCACTTIHMDTPQRMCMHLSPSPHAIVSVRAFGSGSSTVHRSTRHGGLACISPCLGTPKFLSGARLQSSFARTWHIGRLGFLFLIGR